jgi:ribonuclease HI
MTKYVIYTDGSSKKIKKTNTYIGGIGVFIVNNNNDSFNKKFYDKDSTNQKMELIACYLGILKIINYSTFIQNADSIIIYTDSMYTINCITKWAKVWELNNWTHYIKKKIKDVKHSDIIKKIYDIYKKYKIIFVHVYSHKTEPKEKKSDDWNIWYGNYMADKLARSAINI